MKLHRTRSQPRLLERYWTALRSRPSAPPPAALDADVARVATRLARAAGQFDARAPFADQLERQLLSEAGLDPRTHGLWNVPALDHIRPAAPTTSVSEREEHQPMSRLTDTPASESNLIPIPQRRWSRELLKLAAAALVFGIVGAVLVLTLRGDDDSGQPAVAPSPVTATATATTPATPAATQPTTLPSATEARASATATTVPATATTPPTPTISLPTAGSVAATILVGQSPWKMAAGAGSLWVANSNDGTVSRIDPATNTVIATIEVASPGNATADAIAVDDTAVWVTTVRSAFELVRIDPATNQIVASIPTGARVVWLAIGHGAVWGPSLDGNLLRIDPATNAVVASIPVQTPRHMLVTGDAVWVLRDIGNSGASEVLKVDPATNAVVATVSLEDQFGELLYAEGGSVWVSTADGLTQIDAATAQLVTTIPYPEPLRFAPAMTVGNGKVWACRCVGQDTAIAWQLDISTGQWSARIPMGTPAQDAWLVFFDDSLWMSNSAENTVVRSSLDD
jgi:YVTN family beta-propeller protein